MKSFHTSTGHSPTLDIEYAPPREILSTAGRIQTLNPEPRTFEVAGRCLISVCRQYLSSWLSAPQSTELEEEHLGFRV